MVRDMDSFGVMVRVRVGIRVYVKPFCSAEKLLKPKTRDNFSFLGERINKSRKCQMIRTSKRTALAAYISSLHY